MLDKATTISTGEPDATEIGHVRFGKGPSEKVLATGTSLAAYFTSRRDLWEPGGEIPRATRPPRGSFRIHIRGWDEPGDSIHQSDLPFAAVDQPVMRGAEEDEVVHFCEAALVEPAFNVV